MLTILVPTRSAVAGFEGGREPDGEEDEREADAVVPGKFFLQHERREDDEDRESDALLDDLELVAAKLAAEVAAAVRRYHQTVLEERDAPRDEDDHEE